MEFENRSRERKLSELADLAHLALEKMGLTLVEILNEINMAQVFLWLQEKSLFGQGALLHNPTPGVDFSGADLIRNLILVSVMDQSLGYQAQFYRVVHQVVVDHYPLIIVLRLRPRGHSVLGKYRETGRWS